MGTVFVTRTPSPFGFRVLSLYPQNVILDKKEGRTNGEML